MGNGKALHSTEENLSLIVPQEASLRGKEKSPAERASFVAPRTGFEPVISTLKGWRPRPLD